MRVIPKPIHFEWDKANQDKNWIKHKVRTDECAEAFFDNNKTIIEDPRATLIRKKETCMKKKLNIPKFKNKDEEWEFWSNLDLSEYFEKKDFKPVSFPNLKPTTRPVSIRIPSYILARAKEKANALNIPYQSLLKQYIADGVFGDRENAEAFMLADKKAQYGKKQK